MTPAQEQQIAVALRRFKLTQQGLRMDGVPEAAIIQAIKMMVEGWND